MPGFGVSGDLLRKHAESFKSKQKLAQNYPSGPAENMV
jgi:hypothetical protein